MANPLRRQWRRSQPRENDPISSTSLPSTREKRPRDSRLLCGPFTRSARKRSVSFNNAPNPARPRLGSSNPSQPSKEHKSIYLPVAPTRSASAPVPMILHNHHPVEGPDQDSKHVPLDVTLEDDEPLLDHEILSSVDNLSQRDFAHLSTPAESSVIKPPPFEQGPLPQMDSNDQAHTTDSGSAPTEIIDLQDYLSEAPANVAGSTLDDLREVYGPSYQQADDIAGLSLFRRAGSVTESPSPHDMSNQLNSMSDHMTDDPSRFLQGSITPWLLAPSLYSEILYKVTSSIDKQSSLVRPYVNSWILMSLTMSRIDGLRFVFTVHLSFRIHGIPGSSLSLARAAMVSDQEWFKDASNVSFPNLDSGKTVTETSSTNYSKVPAPMNGSDRSQSQNPVLYGMNASLNSMALVSPQQFDPRLLDEESSEDDETEISPSRDGTQPDSQHIISPDVREEESASGEVNSQELVSNDVRGDDTDQAIEASFSHTQSVTLINQVPNEVPSPSKFLENRKALRISKRNADLLSCENAECERTFAKKSELVIHMELRHHDNHRPNPRSQFASSRSRLDSLDDSDVSTCSYCSHSSSRSSGGAMITSNEHLGDNQQVKGERSVQSSTAKRQVQRLGRDFHIRSGKEATDFFVRGRVFEMLWHENSSPFSSVSRRSWRGLSQTLSVGDHGELIHSHIRRFVIVKAGQGHCLGIPVHSFYGKNLKESVSEAGSRQHTINYDSKNPPHKMPHEPFPTKESIPVDTGVDETLDPRSRLSFDKPQSIEWQTRVKNIGMVKGERNLRNLTLSFHAELRREEEEESMDEDRGGQGANSGSEQHPTVTDSEVRSIPSLSWN